MNGLPKTELLDIFFPPRCPFCGQVVARGTGVCAACADIAPHPQRRLLPLEEEAAVPVYAVYAYEGRVREALLRFKFQSAPAAGAFFGKQLAILLTTDSYFSQVEVVTAVPMPHLRRWRRGYNQSELLAKAAAKHLERPYQPLLRVRGHRRVQHLLSLQQRRRNVQGAFVALPQAAGRRILLIDDILTTGATLTACAQQLLAMGAEQVVCAVVAKTQLVTDKD